MFDKFLLILRGGKRRYVQLEMLRPLFKLLAILVVAAGGTATVLYYHNQTAATRQIQKLEQEKIQLQQVVKKLESERRVADVLVSKQILLDGVPNTTLLFVEYDKQGKPLAPRTVTVVGKMVHIDALVIKFDRGLVKDDDPLKGHSIALFTRIYGDRQTPDSAAVLDEPGAIPAIYRGAAQEVTSFELSLWRDFWRLTTDEQYRQKLGVRIANGQGIWGPFEPERLYTLTLESAGGLNLTSEPMKGIYREALKQQHDGSAL